MLALRYILTNLDHFSRLVATLLLLGATQGVASFLVPASIAELTQRGLSLENFYRLVPWILLCFVVSLACAWFLRNYGEALAVKFANHLKLKSFSKVESLPLEVHLDHHSGYLLSLITRVSESSGGLLVSALWLIGHQVATLTLLFFFFTARESMTLALSNLLILVSFLFLSVSLSRRMIPLVGEQNLRQAAFSERFIDLLSNLTTVKKLGIFSFAREQLLARIHPLNQQAAKVQRFHANRWLILHAVFGISFLSTIFFLLYSVVQGTVSASILILFIAAFSSVQGHAERLSEFVKGLMEVSEYLAPLNHILNRNQDRDGAPFPATWQGIHFQDVVYRHPHSEVQIAIKDFKVGREEVVALRGASGSGKSTLLNLIGGLLAPQSGNRWIDDVEYHALSSSELRQQISIVSQEVELFNMSVRDNVALGAALHDQILTETLHGLGLGDWLQNLPSGLDSLVGEKGIKLSTGQKQRLNLARAILLNKPITLLDEPTAHLDPHTEAQVFEYLGRCFKGNSLVIVSHRPQRQLLASRSYRFDGHCLVEEHSE